uniref:Lipase maturation factor n=1 Tax=Xenopsylla cheopis TaxID=163159 RepID=A0A6M2DWC1_XENCH
MLVPIRYTKNLFLRGICFVYLTAFISFYMQIPGLYGENGILPARTQMIKSKDFISEIHNKPTLLWFAPFLGLDIQYMLDVVCICGIILSFSGLLSQKFCLAPVFAALWSLYFSLQQVGQVFMSYQWDNFLLEAGFLTFFAAPWRYVRVRASAITATTPRDHIAFWSIKWLLFRVLFTMGSIKLSSGSSLWWNLSALSTHFETMPLPSPLSWYSHHLPHWFLKVVTASALAMDIVMPILFFMPIRSVRLVGAFLRIVLQLHILATGNFNFFDLLIIVLCLSLLDDKIFLKFRSPPQQRSIILRVASKLPAPMIFSFLAYCLILALGFKFQPNFTISAKLGFTQEQFQTYLPKMIIYSYYLALVNLGYVIVRSLNDVFSQHISSIRIKAFCITFVVLVAQLFLFGLSTVPMSSLHQVSNSTVLPQARSLHQKFSHLYIANSYPIFRKTVGFNSRKEIVIEGSNNIEGPWKEYDFMYKPVHVNNSLSFAAPYQPRLDWQMHFASRGTYHQHPWIMSLAYRLLEGRPEVLTLLANNPSFNKPPKYIRASLYNYKYAPWTSRDAWWTREKVGEYFPVFTIDHPPLLDYLKNMNIIQYPNKETKPVSPIFKTILDRLRFLICYFDGSFLLWFIFLCLMISVVFRRQCNISNRIIF